MCKEKHNKQTSVIKTIYCKNENSGIKSSLNDDMLHLVTAENGDEDR